jgi:hypothetical protein
VAGAVCGREAADAFTCATEAAHVCEACMAAPDPLCALARAARRSAQLDTVVLGRSHEAPERLPSAALCHAGSATELRGRGALSLPALSLAMLLLRESAELWELDVSGTALHADGARGGRAAGAAAQPAASAPQARRRSRRCCRRTSDWRGWTSHTMPWARPAPLPSPTRCAPTAC